MSPRNEDFLFAQEAQRLGFVTEAQVEEGFLLQRRMSEELQIDERLAVILVKRGWIAEEQARRVYDRIQPAGGKDQIEGYRILERIGHGAMGTVYKALHLGLQRVVAIKVLRRDLASDPTQTQRLKEEARILASLDHPNIVRALDVGESNGFPFFVMEYVEGETLKDRIAREGPLDEVVALRIARDVADALEQARRMGVVHRDVKPGNVMLPKKGGPKLMDLGLAKGPVDLGLTQHGATVGTPQFISPEQAQDPRRADTRSDIYSLGATLYAMVTGRPPCTGATLAEILTKVLYREPTPARALNKALSQECEYLIERMMLKDPSLRHRTPAEVVHDVDELLAGRSIVPDGFKGNWEGYLLRRRMRRGWTIAAAAAVVLLAVGGWVGIYARQARHREAVSRAGRDVDAALRETALLRTDDLAALRAKARRAGAVRDAVAGVAEEIERYPLLAGHVAALEDELVRHERLPDALREARGRADVGDYAGAIERLRSFSATLPRIESPVRRRVEDEVGGLRVASQADVGRLRDETLRHSPPSFEAYLAFVEGARASLDRGFVEDENLRAARGVLDDGVQVLTRIRSEVEAMERAFSGESLERHLEPELRLRRLREQFDRMRTEVLDGTKLAWRPLEAAHWIPTSVVVGHVEQRLDALEDRLNETVLARWHVAAAAARAASAAGDHAGALARVDAWRRAAMAGNFPRVRADAAELHDALRTAQADWEKRAEIFLRNLQEDVLALLRRGRVEAARARVTEALARLPDDAPQRPDVERMLVLPGALAMLYTSALDGLWGMPRRRVQDVRLRDGTIERLWDVVDVHHGEQAVTVVVDRRGAPQRRDLAEVDPRQLLAWAEAWEVQQGRAPPPIRPDVRLAALLAAPLPEGETDLRPTRDHFAALVTAFEHAHYGGSLAAWAADKAEMWKREQDRREADARSAWQTASRHHYLRGQYESAYHQLLNLTKEGSNLRLTDAFEQREAEIQALMTDVLKELANRRLAEKLPGAKIRVEGTGPDARTVVLLDWQDPAQLQIPLRGDGVLEPYARPDPNRPVTPGEEENLRLHLHRGVDALVRHRPFVLPNVFDPAAPIKINFDLYTVEAPFFFAVDVDGLKVGILSADPWSPAFRERWRLPPDLEPIRQGDQVPTLAGYGRGRGVAFHAGAGWGDPATWDWPSAGHGRNHRDWDPDRRRRPLPPELFAFEPGRVYRVEVQRDRGRISLRIEGTEVASAEKDAWAEVGATSDRDRRVRRGTGLIQFLTWTPQAIDDLRMEGVLLERWR